MKVLAIRGKNLASLSSAFEVDFQAEPLASAGLFAITGPTGAGKSTLLDALCLALYDATPRLNKANSRNSDVPDTGGVSIAQHDPRTTLRRGAAEGFAEVDFVGNDGMSYRARWTVRRAYNRANGKLQDSEMSLERLIDQQPIAAHRKKETLKLIESKIGLTFDQFTRAVLLAQNDFATFLKANDDERAELLQTLTGTETFADISKLAFVRMREEKEKLERLEEQRSTLAPLPPEVRAEKEVKLKVQNEQLAILEKAKGETESRLRWFESLDKLKSIETDANSKLQSAKLSQVSAQPRCQTLARIEQIQPARSLLEERTRLFNEVASTTRIVGERQKEVVLAGKNLEKCAAELEVVGKLVAQAEAEKTKSLPLIDTAKSLDAKLAALTQPYEHAVKARDNANSAHRESVQKYESAKQTVRQTETALVAAEHWLAEHQDQKALAEGWRGWEAMFGQALSQTTDKITLSKEIAELTKRSREVAAALTKAQAEWANRPSNLGEWSYEVLDTKLARSAKAKFIIQLAYYSAMVERIQGVAPLLMHVILGDKTEATYRVADFARYLNMVTQRFLARVNGDFVESYPVPCAKCDQCKWKGLCEEQRLKDDHLCQVANITRLQIKKLESAGIKTLEALATLPENVRIPKMAVETESKLYHQARLQFQARQTGQRCLELLPFTGGELRGFARLPKPAVGDLYFDMEGDPLEEGGLEYLFGLYLFQDGEAVFKTFWAHNRAEEKRAFEDFMDFVTSWLRSHPDAHIYHYAAYEQTALKKLMSLHGTREAEVDNLLRAQKLVDLYKVVREGIRVSEPRYSIKNIEHFYLDSRTGDVKNAGASIVYYERWKETGDPQFLQDIADYNCDDVRSTYELREWLLSLRPEGVPWFSTSLNEEATAPEVGELTDAERRLILYREQLVDPLPADRSTWGVNEHLKELTYQLLDFHRRATKPEWWAMFSRKEMTDEELLDDGECLAGLIPDTTNPPSKEKRSIRYTYLFPEQESKLKSGDTATITQTTEAIRNILVDEESRRVSFTRGAGKEALPSSIALGPSKPVTSDSLIEAVFRFGDSVVSGQSTYAAIEAILTQKNPEIRGHTAGQPIVMPGVDALEATKKAIANLDSSYIFVQGPPGAGKTYTGSHVIVSLLMQGSRVGVSSNSHKAINNLLRGVEEVAKEKSFTFRGAKKSTAQKSESCFDGEMIEDVFVNGDILEGLDGPFGYQLVAGTAWLFADEDMDQKLDYLFVDEAGQVALANLVAMGTSAKNIVLLGDQMQLGQPIQGVHPGRSGESSLEYLLNGLATIPPEQGIFLGTTWRMHPDVCKFISDAVYDSRLESEPNTANQSLLLGVNAHPALKATGSDRYKPCFKLVELFLKGTPPDVTGGATQAFSLFFDMNVLFEEYIGRMARRVFVSKGYQVVLQGPQQSLAVDLDNQRPVFAMKPDVVGRFGGRAAWILDTKWKPLSLQKSKEGVNQDDLYQMYAYANCYDCSDVVLLYPHHQELGGVAGIRSSFGLNPWIRPNERPFRRVRIATVDLSELKTVPEQLERIFPNAPIEKGGTAGVARIYGRPCQTVS